MFAHTKHRHRLAQHGYNLTSDTRYFLGVGVVVAFHDTDTDSDILARIVVRLSACRSADHRNNFRKSRVSDVSAMILATVSVSVSASWNARLKLKFNGRSFLARIQGRTKN